MYSQQRAYPLGRRHTASHCHTGGRDVEPTSLGEKRTRMDSELISPMRTSFLGRPGYHGPRALGPRAKRSWHLAVSKFAGGLGGPRPPRHTPLATPMHNRIARYLSSINESQTTFSNVIRNRQMMSKKAECQ